MIVEESKSAGRRLVLGGLGVVGLLYLTIFILPMLFMVGVSFGAVRLGISQELPNVFAAYQRFWTSSYHQQTVWRTVRLALLTVVGTFAIALPLAHLTVSSSRTFRTLTMLAVLSPLFTSVIIRTYGLRQLLSWIGVERSFLAVLIGCTQVFLPFMFIPLMNGLRDVDPLIVHSAKTLGAGRTRIAFRVILPVLAPSIVAGCALVFVLCFNVVAIPLLLGNPTHPTMGLQVYQSGYEGADFTFASAVAMTMLLVALGVLILQRVLVRRTGRENVL